jgi:YesN/AraC family two-component response regulator
METKAILLVDDEQITRRSIQKTLEKWSDGRFEIFSAPNGQKALEIMAKHKINLLITDISMPEIDGIQLLEMLNSKGYRFVTIIISGYPNFDYAREAIRLCVVDYILKPISKQKLFDSIELALKKEASNERIEYITKVTDEKILHVDGAQKESEYISVSKKYITDNLSRAITLKEVADIVHLNACYFSVLFKEQTGLVFSEYVTRKRMQKAKKLLLSSDMQIEEISEQVGYQTSKYFIKMFKDIEGVTPSKFRKTV